VLAGCGSSKKGAAAPTDGTPKPGGTLTIIKGLEQSTGWDPVNLAQSGRQGSNITNSAVYDSLFTEDPKTFALQPRLALSATTADGGTNWVIKLRPNVKFSDGTAFDAEAVKFNWARIADPANKATTASTAAAISTMTAADPTTLNVTLKSPDLYFDHRIAQYIDWIASPTAIKTEGADYANKPVGAGPFIMTSRVLNSETVLTKNPNYWEAGKPYLDKVVVKVVTDATQGYNSFKAGAANMIQQNDPNTIIQAQADKFTVQIGAAQGGGFALAFNNSKAPFNNANARKAIDLALNRDQFIQTRYNGNQTWAMPSIEKKGTPFYNATIAPAKYDATEAQKAVDAYLAETGQTSLSFSLLAFDGRYLTQDAQVLQAQLNQLKNVKVTLDAQQPATALTAYLGGNFQAFGGLTQRWNVPAIDLVSTFLTGSSQNIARYSNPDVDAALRKLQQTPSSDQKGQQALIEQVEKQVLADHAVAYYQQYVTATTTDKTVHGVEARFDGQAYLDNAWIG
jgi:peptide/nickel transport system substrate-binding protein